MEERCNNIVETFVMGDICSKDFGCLHVSNL